MQKSNKGRGNERNKIHTVAVENNFLRFDYLQK